MSRIIGIDLGTTNTSVAVLENGRPRVIEDERGYKVLPSVVSAKGEGRFVVGQAAHSMILTHPNTTVYAAKRLIGRRFDSREVQQVRGRVHFDMRESRDGGVELAVGDAWMTPQEVAAVVLQVARGIAEKSLGEHISEAVITVPAHFTHAQRMATLEAARLADLHCERLLNEPTAAALAYGHRRTGERTLVIFDLDGGTFDVSVLKLHDGVYEILATGGDTFLGGEDFDYRIVDHLADEFMVRHRVDLRKDRASLQRLKDAAERAKCELSFSDRANVLIAHAIPGQNLETILTRQRLEDLTTSLVASCIDVAKTVVADAGLAIGDVDEVILVGGQTRMPRVREAVAAVFGREASRTVHPEEAVAIGAAVHAHSLEDIDGPRAVLLDVTPLDLGIDASGGMFVPIIKRNAQVPCSESKVFATVHDDQESVRITVRQGGARRAADNEFLGEFVFGGLPKAPKLQTKVSVNFRIDANGVLHVAAVDPVTGEKRNISIRNYAEHANDPCMPGDAVPPPPLVLEVAPLPPEADAPAMPATKETPAVKKKVGLLESILGVRKPKKVAEKKPASPVPASPGPSLPVAAADDDEDSTPGILLDGGFSGIDLSSIAAEQLPHDAVVPDDALLPADDDDLYGDDGRIPAAFGLAGSYESGRHAGGSDPFADEVEAAPADTELDPFDQPRGPTRLPMRATPSGENAGFAFATEEVPELDEHGGDAFAMPEDEEMPSGPSRRGEPYRPALTEEDFQLPLGDDEEGDPAADADTSARAGHLPPPGPSPDAFDKEDNTATRPMPVAPPIFKKAKKPARVRLTYKHWETFAREYTENLRRNGAFIRTDKPLVVGRECEFEISAPGLPEALVFSAVVVAVSDGRGGLEAGMRVEYRLDAGARRKLEQALQGV